MLQPIPFAPIRSSLYSPATLMSGLEAGDFKSFARTTDFRCFEYFVEHGKIAPNDALAGMTNLAIRPRMLR